MQRLPGLGHRLGPRGVTGSELGGAPCAMCSCHLESGGSGGVFGNGVQGSPSEPQVLGLMGRRSLAPWPLTLLLTLPLTPVPPGYRHP